MSKVQVAGNASGTGIFTIASPNSNTDRTLTLPDNTGTLLTTSSAIQRSQLPTGSVLQVVSATYNTQVSNATGTLSATGLSATITPTSATSKVLVIVHDPMRMTGGTVSGFQTVLYKNGSALFYVMSNTGYANPSTADRSWIVSFNYLDSPASTSALTYALYFAQNSGSGTVYAQIDGTGNTGSITLMEIAA